MKVSVVGLGKLGAPMAAVFAAKGHEVLGLDANEAVVASVQSGRAPVVEPRLQEMMHAGRARLSATSDPKALIDSSDVTFIIVPTPSDAAGSFSNKYILEAVEVLAPALRSKAGYHVLTVTSTVMPGSMENVIKPALERGSGRIVGKDVGLCYNPEFIALGSVIDDMLEPDFLLIGESDERAGALVASVYETVCKNNPPARRMNFVNAELTKISVNTFVTTKISYANMLADICDRLPGADVDVVTAAVGSDSRIGRKYLRGAIGYGGPCFPRDNAAFAAVAQRVGARPDIARATEAINRYQMERLTNLIAAKTAAGARVAILGMAYKPDTLVIEESQGLMLARELIERGFTVTIHDPQGTRAASEVLGHRAEAAPSAVTALEKADIAIITTPWNEYRSLDKVRLGRRLQLIDCWRLLPLHTASLEVIWLGVGQQPSLAATQR